MACNIDIPIQNYLILKYISYILCKCDENRSSNSRHYEGNKWTFLDEMAKIGLLSLNISPSTGQIFTNVSALVDVCMVIKKLT